MGRMVPPGIPNSQSTFSSSSARTTARAPVIFSFAIDLSGYPTCVWVSNVWSSPSEPVASSGRAADARRPTTLAGAPPAYGDLALARSSGRRLAAAGRLLGPRGPAGAARLRRAAPAPRPPGPPWSSGPGGRGGGAARPVGRGGPAGAARLRTPALALRPPGPRWSSARGGRAGATRG